MGKQTTFNGELSTGITPIGTGAIWFNADNKGCLLRIYGLPLDAVQALEQKQEMLDINISCGIAIVSGAKHPEKDLRSRLGHIVEEIRQQYADHETAEGAIICERIAKILDIKLTP